MPTVHLAYLLALSAAIAFDRLRLPAGSMLGALLGILVADLIGLQTPPANPGIVTLISVIVGITLALRFHQSLIKTLVRLVVPALYASIIMTGMGYGFGFALVRISGWEPATAMFSAYPGGLEQMVLIAGALGGDVYTVTVIQLTRWISVVTLFPLVAAWSRRRVSNSGNTSYEQRDVQSIAPASIDKTDMITIFIGVAGGLGAVYMKLPAGALLGSFVCVALSRAMLSQHALSVAPTLNRVLLAIIGIVMGSGVDTRILYSGQKLFLVAVGLVLTLFTFCAVFALLLTKITGWPFGICLIALAPAGTLEMTLLSEQLGYDPTPVFILHFARTVSVIIAAPMLFAWTFS